MAVDVPGVREVIERVFTRNDVLDACKRRDLGAVIDALCAQGVTQIQLSPGRPRLAARQRLPR